MKANIDVQELATKLANSIKDKMDDVSADEIQVTVILRKVKRHGGFDHLAIATSEDSEPDLLLDVVMHLKYTCESAKAMAH